MNLDHDLERLLHRQSPPEGFRDRVLARVGSQRSDRRSRWRAAAASVTFVALIAGYAAQQVADRRREEGERARDEVVLALRIASEKVRYAQQEVRAIGTEE